MDHMFSRLHVPYSLTAEVYGGKGDWRECYQYFNPTDRESYQRTTANWATSLLHTVAVVLRRARYASDAVAATPTRPLYPPSVSYGVQGCGAAAALPRAAPRWRRRRAAHNVSCAADVPARVLTTVAVASLATPP